METLKFVLSRRSLYIIAVFCFLALQQSEAASEASCKNSINTWAWNDKKQNLTTCYPDTKEVCDEDFTISTAKDSKVLALNIPYKNDVKLLPVGLSRTFPELIVFQVVNCSVRTVNEHHFKGLSKLEFVNLGFNKIENVASKAFVDLVNLESLGLNNNKIQFIGKNTFAALKSLMTLYLDDNEIQIIHPKSFKPLLNVELVNLDRNDIECLDENIFASLMNLKNVSVAGNKVARIPKDLFRANLKLERIWLNDNRINSIDANMFDHLKNLTFVHLNDNVCVDATYYSNKFDSMRTDLKQKCAAKKDL